MKNNHKSNFRLMSMPLLLIVAGLFTFNQQALARNPQRILDLYAGEVHVLKIGQIDRVAVGNGKLLSTSITKSGQLIILAEAPGETIIHLWGKKHWERDYLVKISKSNPSTAVKELRALLTGVRGVEIRSVGGRPVIDGMLGKEASLKVDAIKKVYPNILDIAQRTEASYDKMIVMKVKITQFSSNHLDQLGINWQTSINGPATGGVWAPRQSGPVSVTIDGTTIAAPVQSPSFGYFGIVTSMTSRLNLMESDGDALVLASPTLATRSGGKAEFLAGGKIPLPTTNAQGQSNVTFEEFGVKLNIAPTVDREGNITAHLETEISAPDQSIKPINGIPGFFTRRSNADLSMKEGQTMVISGLLSSDLSKNVNGVKYLMDIPILGALFRNNDRTDKKTELVIFVTPQVIDADSQYNKDMISQREKMIKKFRTVTEFKDWIHQDSGNRDLLE